MKLEFDNLNELQAFMAFAGYGKLNTIKVAPLATAMAEFAGIADPETLTNSAGLARDIDAVVGTAHAAMAQTWMRGAVSTSGEVNAPVTGEPGPEMTNTPAPAPRKRRTKAEIEADKAAQAAVAQGVDEVPAPTGETPAQAAIRQALEAAKLAKEAKAAGDAELAQTASAVSDALSPTDPKLLPHEFIQKRGAELGELQAIEHLNLARNFIAKHGMPKYNESFTLAGLSANVMAYAPTDCAMHAAALEWLDQA